MSKNKEFAPGPHIVKFAEELVGQYLGINAPPPNECKIMYGVSDDWCDTEMYLYWQVPMSFDTVSLQVQYNVPMYLMNAQQITKKKFIKELSKIKQNIKDFEKLT
jgi:hypothetical protein